MDDEFLSWLSTYLGTDRKEEVQNLLNDPLARYFLIIWSIYEAKCFDGFVKIKDFDEFVRKLTTVMNISTVEEHAKYFYDRYQDEDKRRNLLHKQQDSKFDQIIKKTFNELKDEDKFYLLVHCKISF